MFSLSQILENSLRSADAQLVTDVFLITIILLYGYLWRRAAARRQPMDELLEHAPSLFTSLGILGTFVGIVIGLLNFDTSHIDESIQALLEGLKTAFITSLIGIIAAIAFKAHRSRWQNKTADDEHPMTALDLLRLQADEMLATRKAIAGDEDSSLLTQIMKLRTDLNDGLKKNIETMTEAKDLAFDQRDEMKKAIMEKMEQFAEMLSDAATKQVIEALENVIKDFNQNLTEQFGENFKALDASVQKLVVWQENYREQLEEMQKQYAQGVEAISETSTMVTQISEKTQAIPETMTALQQIVTVNQNQIQELERHLEAFEELRDKAVSAVPQIQQQLDDTVAAFGDAGRQLADGLQKSAESVEKAIIAGAEEFNDRVHRVNENLTGTSDTLAKSAEMIREQMDDAVSDLNNAIRDMVSRVGDEAEKINKQLQEAASHLENDIRNMQSHLEKVIEDVFASQREAAQKALHALEEELKKTVGMTEEMVNEQLKAIDRAMEQEIERVMNGMGQALASISGQFTKDYSSLVNTMSRIIHEIPGTYNGQAN